MVEGTEAHSPITFSLKDAPKPLVLLVVEVAQWSGEDHIYRETGNIDSSRKEKSKELGAADTFRAAAVDQLTIWSERAQVNIVAKGMNTDPSAVAFETLQKGIEQKKLMLCSSIRRVVFTTR